MHDMMEHELDSTNPRLDVLRRHPRLHLHYLGRLGFVSWILGRRCVSPLDLRSTPWIFQIVPRPLVSQ